MTDVMSKQILEFVAGASAPGATEAAIASAVGGMDAWAISEECESLMANGELVRVGEGTEEAPYTYQIPDGAVPRL